MSAGGVNNRNNRIINFKCWVLFTACCAANSGPKKKINKHRFKITTKRHQLNCFASEFIKKIKILIYTHWIYNHHDVIPDLWKLGNLWIFAVHMLPTCDYFFIHTRMYVLFLHLCLSFRVCMQYIKRYEIPCCVGLQDLGGVCDKCRVWCWRSRLWELYSLRATRLITVVSLVPFCL